MPLRLWMSAATNLLVQRIFCFLCQCKDLLAKHSGIREEDFFLWANEQHARNRFDGGRSLQILHIVEAYPARRSAEHTEIWPARAVDQSSSERMTAISNPGSTANISHHQAA